MQPVAPFWFRQRQGKMEPAEQDRFRLTAPNAAEAYISVRATENGHWLPILQLTPDGQDTVTSNVELERPEEAWNVAFELYRRRLVV
jgi:hypothetical protein